jgi:4'-phosphopantetheinyl transferase
VSVSGPLAQMLAAGASVEDWSPALPAGATCHLFDRTALPAFRGELYLLATAEEHRRASSFDNGSRADDFILARGLVRAILRQRFGPSVAGLPIVDGPGGRPQLAGTPKPGFSISRSGNVLGIAINAAGAIGLDIEEFDGADAEPTGLSPAEATILAALPAGQQPRAALLAWTLKEATAKRDGATLWSRPEAIDATLALRWASGGMTGENGVHFRFLRFGPVELAASIVL